MKRKLLIASIWVALSSCSHNYHEFALGPWLGIITIDSTETNTDMPFTMNHFLSEQGKDIIEIINADEKIRVTEIIRNGDTLEMKLPVFSSEMIAVIQNGKLEGKYYPKGLETGIFYKFIAIQGITDRFPDDSDKALYDVTGRWEMIESPGTPDSSLMIGEFKQDGSHLVGTILTTSGDYRYLEGKVSGNKLMLSALDGVHSLLITADITNPNTIENGRFVGSPKWKTVWKARRNENAVLPEMESLIRVKKGITSFDFSCMDLNGNTVTSNDLCFKGKVRIFLITGSWCPNCMDEARMYKDIYEKYKGQGLEIVSLCFESKDFDPSKVRIQRFIDQTGAGYPFYYAGARNKEVKDSVLSMFEGMVAFPTSVFIDRKGNIRELHTGFTGPATSEYPQFVEETITLIELLLAEK